MKKRIITALLCLFAIYQAVAQNVVITGRVNRSDTEMRLVAYDDLITWQPTELTKTVTDDKGFFILETTVNQILPAAIVIDMENVDFYIAPNSDFDIVITVFEPEADQSYFERPMPKIRFRKADDKGINRQINTIDAIFTSYMLDHYVEICRGHEYKYLDSINADIKAYLPDIKIDYVKNYTDYKTASLRLALDADGGTKVKNEFFDQKSVLYAHPAYIEVFKEVFNDYFFKQKYASSCFDDAFHTSTEQLRQCLENDPFLAKNKQLSELVLAYNLFKMYDDRNTRNLANQHLKYLQDHAKYADNKCVVNNFYAKKNRFSNGSDAPKFTLHDAKGNEHKMTDYADKMLLLQFVDSYIPMYDRHFERLKELQQQWGDTIQIITIATKESVSTFGSKFKTLHIDWPLLNLENNTALLEQYEVRMFPEYVIIKRNNKIGMLPAPSPDQFLDKYVTLMYGK